ncbi:hypothetical protein AN1V17_35230 [Vallitalea sediminicola]
MIEDIFILGGIIIGVIGYFQDGTNQKSLYALCLAFFLVGVALIVLYVIIRNKSIIIQRNIRTFYWLKSGIYSKKGLSDNTFF